MAYKSWGSASWSTSNADGLFVGGNHVASVVASVAAQNQLSLLRLVLAGAPVSGAALIVAVVGSVEVVVGLVEEDAEEGSGIEEDLETGEAVVSEEVEAAAAASEEAGTTLDHREVEVATGSCFCWMT